MMSPLGLSTDLHSRHADKLLVSIDNSAGISPFFLGSGRRFILLVLPVIVSGYCSVCI